MVMVVAHRFTTSRVLASGQVMPALQSVNLSITTVRSNVRTKTVGSNARAEAIAIYRRTMLSMVLASVPMMPAQLVRQSIATVRSNARTKTIRSNVRAKTIEMQTCRSATLPRALEDIILMMPMHSNILWNEVLLATVMVLPHRLSHNLFGIALYSISGCEAYREQLL